LKRAEIRAELIMQKSHFSQRKHSRTERKTAEE
jgi:hypothetical protein